ncbi:hypothetical protein [Sphingopyxis sp. PET50]|uniref:hypothetical protein n=1 Tax=Sphingopyxis sp. PET50 TaxID=2976533 RepID=UPI0021AE918B|nr:hypothetical protein [Sphingopyxis sp. PET50]
MNPRVPAVSAAEVSRFVPLAWVKISLCARHRVAGIRAALDRGAVAVGVVDEVLPREGAAAAVHARQPVDAVVTEGQAVRRRHQVGDRDDIVVGVIAIGDCPSSEHLAQLAA